VADELNVSIAGVAYPHRLYQFALAYSGWRYAEVVLGGESYYRQPRRQRIQAVFNR